MKFWQSLFFHEVDQLAGTATICEALGFHGVLLPDHLCVPEKIQSRYLYAEDGAPPFDASTQWAEAWTAIAAMAAVTERLHFSTAVYVAPLRRPLELAKTVATAATLSGGRVALGVGAGWMEEEFRIQGEGFRDRGRRLDELLDVCRLLWSGETVEHHGAFYDFPRLVQTPAPPPIPIYVGGASPAALRRAARHDGWLSSGNTPEEAPALVDRLRALRAEGGRSGEPFEIVMALTAPPDPDLLRRLEDRGVTGIVSYPLSYVLGPGSTLEAKREALERYANDVIARTR